MLCRSQWFRLLERHAHKQKAGRGRQACASPGTGGAIYKHTSTVVSSTRNANRAEWKPQQHMTHYGLLIFLMYCPQPSPSLACVPLLPTPAAAKTPAALTFRIGPDFDSAREFVYKLGPQRLDELLSAKVVSELLDIAIRSIPPSLSSHRCSPLSRSQKQKKNGYFL